MSEQHGNYEDFLEEGENSRPMNQDELQIQERLREMLKNLSEGPCPCGDIGCKGITLYRILHDGANAHRWDSVAAALAMLSCFMDELVDEIIAGIPAESRQNFDASMLAHTYAYMRQIGVNTELHNRRN